MEVLDDIAEKESVSFSDNSSMSNTIECKKPLAGQQAKPLLIHEFAKRT